MLEGELLIDPLDEPVELLVVVDVVEAGALLLLELDAVGALLLDVVEAGALLVHELLDVEAGVLLVHELLDVVEAGALLDHELLDVEAGALEVLVVTLETGTLEITVVDELPPVLTVTGALVEIEIGEYEKTG